MHTDKSKPALPQAGEVLVRVSAFAAKSKSYTLPAVDQLSSEGGGLLEPWGQRDTPELFWLRDERDKTMQTDSTGPGQYPHGPDICR